MASALGLVLAVSALGCPFCTALEPTLSSRRELAVVVALGEVRGGESKALEIRLHQVLKGNKLLAGRTSIVAPADGPLKAGTLVLIFGDLPEGDPDDRRSEGGDKAIGALRFSTTAVTETSFAYFARAPDLRTPAAERLRYFARFLENADPTIAGDAYQEFAHASFGDVRKSGRRAARRQDERLVVQRAGAPGPQGILCPGSGVR